MINIKQTLLAGIKSGVISGALGAVMFGVYVEIILLASTKNIAMFYYIIPLFVIGVPTGLLAGAILGLSISYVVLKKDNIAQHVTIPSIFIGGFTGSIYPLCLIFLTIHFQDSISQEEMIEIVIALIGGLLSGGIAGFLGSKLFLHSLNE